MRAFLFLFLAILVVQLSHAAEPGNPKIMLQYYRVFPLDACMDEYNQLSQINEAVYGSAIAYCYTVYQDPYNMLCHGQAILTWSGYQDQIFDYFVMCQNGNYGKSQPDKK